MRVQGPYVYPSGPCAGRRYVVLVDGSTKRQILYSRWLMEQHLGRRLDPSEHVHHVNEDKTDDRLENLAVKERSLHMAEHMPEIEMIEIVCPECGGTVQKEARKVRHNRKQGKAGPFCGKSCSGTWSRRRQLMPT